MIRAWPSSRVPAAVGVLTAVLSTQGLQAQSTTEEPTEPALSISDSTSGFEHLPGFLDLYWDSRGGRLFLYVDSLDADLLYIESLSAGLGSNDIGLDRGQLGRTHLARFERVGPKLLLVQQNTRYRALSDNVDERRAVADAFARSVLWGFEVAAEDEDGAVLVDATDFVLRDAHGVVARLQQRGQGSYQLDASRSAIHRSGVAAFPRNSELEGTLTFTLRSADRGPGAWVREVAPSPEAVTVRVRHSFVALPEPGYEPRRADPRSGFMTTGYLDYATPIDQPLEASFINRHRLRKRDPKAERSEPVEPIVYYLDRGAPEPIRSALLDGARWWNEAFEAAGYIDAFRVELLPEGADLLDIRYNVIQWVHRSTRGWSYGGGVSDPRTGEILKGHVTLGSLRVRQDFLIAQGLSSPYEDADSSTEELTEMALARLRQLSAHEVGHAIGLVHNFASSVDGPNGRESVMDYPHPLAILGDDGTIDLSAAYDVPAGHPAAGQPLILPDFAVDFIDQAFATRESLLCMARKNAKSAFVAATVLACLAAPWARPSWRAGVASVNKDKAGELRDQVRDLAEAAMLPGVRVVHREVSGPRGGSASILAATDSAGHASGFDLAVLDELGLFRERRRELVEGMLSSVSARDGRSLALSIHGDGPFVPELIERGRQGAACVHLHQAPAGCALDDRAAWAMANPGLEVGIKSLDYMADMARRASLSGESESYFRLHDLNQAVRAGRKLLLVSLEEWKRIEVDQLPPRAGRCFLGVDLGGSRSLTYAVAYWPDSGRVEFRGAIPGVPSLVDRGRRDGYPSLYTRAAERGEIDVQEGRRTVDGARFMGDVVEWLAGETVVGGSDRYRRSDMEQALADADISWRWHWRGTGHGRYADGSADVRAFQTAILERAIRVDRSALWRQAVAEVELRHDSAGNLAIDKSRPTSRIDLMQAGVIALGLGRAVPVERPRRLRVA